MDWSKAKNILIIALLAINLCLGIVLLSNINSENGRRREAAESARLYLESKGVIFNCEIPYKAVKLPVLFVDFDSKDSVSVKSRYKSYKLEIIGGDGEVPVSIEAGEGRGQISTASSALMSTLHDIEGGCEVSAITLEYLIDRSEYKQYGEDTAFPVWKIESSIGNFYVQAIN